MHPLVRPPLLLLHVAGILAVTIAGWLGWWQIGAWQAHREDRSAALADAEPLVLDDALGPDEAFSGEHVGRPVEVRGRWLPDVLHVEDRLRTSDPDSGEGVWQVGLLQVCADRTATACDVAPSIPIVLGWSADPGAGPRPAGDVDLVGWLQPSEAGDGDAVPADVDTLPALRTADLVGRVPADVYSGYVILRDPADLRGDLVAVTPESLPDPPASTALRNLFYGLEWWVFAGFAAYLWFQWSRDAVRSARAREGAAEAAEDQPIASGA